jgi:hypothetical protein
VDFTHNLQVSSVTSDQVSLKRVSDGAAFADYDLQVVTAGDDTGNTIALNLHDGAELEANQDYELTVKTGITDVFGIALHTAVTTTFHVASTAGLQPRITNVGPTFRPSWKQTRG